MPRKKKPQSPIQFGKTGFTFLPSFYFSTARLKDERKLEVRNAIIEFAFTGKRLKLSDEADEVYLDLIIPSIESSLRNYQRSSSNDEDNDS